MRAFIALEIPPELEDEIAALARELKASVKGRLVPRENYHLTLAFLGDAGERQLADAMRVLDEATARFGAIELKPNGLGKFGRAHDATLWLGFEEDPALMELATFVRDGLETCGVDFDAKPFVPHLTIARRAALDAGALPALPFPLPAHTSELALFKSTLTRDGAVYDVVYEVELE
ncbi:MAG: RNA 2',3'-cyclic phosphodiesterase [Coriobacteriales bacterium]